MSVDILVLNTAVVDFRHSCFTFADELVRAGGLAKCAVADLPPYSQEQLYAFIHEDRCVTLGGSGNCAPLMARTGLKTAVCAYFGNGDYSGLDVAGRFFCDSLTQEGIDVTGCQICDSLPSGMSFIRERGNTERGGIAYYANANDEFDFNFARSVVQRLCPTIAYYMYPGLSKSGDANNGQDLAAFLQWCKARDVITVIDSATLSDDLQNDTSTSTSRPHYGLLQAPLAQSDIFFTSSDEARSIAHAFDLDSRSFLTELSTQYWAKDSRTKLFGVTYKRGAQYISYTDARATGPVDVPSKFTGGEVVDLVGAGDSFRAGLLAYIVRNVDDFRDGTIDFRKAVHLGNLFACLYIKAPLIDRCKYITDYNRMVTLLEDDIETLDFARVITWLGFKEKE
jgi:sugar/nucleoside kinase (ribokinase family)